MNNSQHSWERVILMFAIVVTTATMLAYRLMITYNFTIPPFMWVLLVVVSALTTIGPRFIRRRR